MGVTIPNFTQLANTASAMGQLSGSPGLNLPQLKHKQQLRCRPFSTDTTFTQLP